jgi:Na+:H+ antiporter, NhaA family
VLRILLLSYAIVDDIGAILVIALFYTGEISWLALGIAVSLLAVMGLARRLAVQNMSVYWALGVAIWAATLESGVHAIIAGVVLGTLAPPRPLTGREHFAEKARERADEIRESLERGEHEQSEELLGELEQLAKQTESPLERLERSAHPWVSFAILPLFAFLNAGVAISLDLLCAAAVSPLALGIVLGFLVGKPLGITAAAWLSVRLALAELPADVKWRHIAGVGLFGGVGFTVALFIAGLAFTDERLNAIATIAILTASLSAMAAGWLVLLFSSSREAG